MADLKKVDLLLEYALAIAAQQDDFRDRELGPIHLLKYVYLADLAFAQRNGGQTYTGIPWRFYHYGPWSAEVFQRIDPVIQSSGAEILTIESPYYEKDTVRFRLRDRDRADSLVQDLPFVVARVVKNAVHEFGRDTGELLNHVYLTKPMVRAAPNEILDFTIVPPSTVPTEIPATTPTPKQKMSEKTRRRRKEALEGLRQKVRAKLEERRARRPSPPAIPPRYDSVFFEGLKCFDADVGGPVQKRRGNAEVGESVWKSPSRSEGDVS